MTKPDATSVEKADLITTPRSTLRSGLGLRLLKLSLRGRGDMAFKVNIRAVKPVDGTEAIASFDGEDIGFGVTPFYAAIDARHWLERNAPLYVIESFGPPLGE